MAPDESRPALQPPGTLRIGRFRGIAIYVRASWVLVAVLIAVVMAPRVDQVHPGLGAGKYVAGLAFAVLLYGSVFLHELSHALMALRVGLKVRSISLQFLGGATEIEGESGTAAQEFKVAVVGPLTSLVLGGAALALLPTVPDGLPRLALEGLAGATLVVGVLNLIPGLPLDGGRVLRAIVWQARGNMHTGTIAAAWGGRAAAALALVSPLLVPPLFDRSASTYDYFYGCLMAAFLWSGASASLINARLRQRLPALKARPLARRVVAVAEDLSVAEAVRRAQELDAGGIVVHAADQSLVGIVHEAALLSIPEERRPWVPVSSVARTLTAGLVLPADSAGEDLIRAMARTPANEYVLVEPDGSLYGLLVTADVDAAFEAGAGA